jgi:hypothetical protein
MARRSKQAALEVRASFEPARIAAQCLIEAYERALPVQRRPTRSGFRQGPGQEEAAAKPPRAQGSEHA